MLDIRLIRENPEFVKERLAVRGGDLHLKIDEILDFDRQRRHAETQLQQIQADRKRISKEIGAKKAKGEDTSAIEAEVRGFGDQMKELEAQSAQAGELQTALLLNLPNLPHAACPAGKEAADNPVVRSWGEKPVIENPLDHIKLGEKLGLFDFERASKLSGAGFVCFTGIGARLQRGLINFCLDLHTREHGYNEVSTPFIVRREALIGTGQLPKFEDQLYAVPGEDMFLVPTAEVPVTNLYREELLTQAELPKQMAAYTPCFRSEAGAAGLGTRGMIRIHQFDKVELVKITTPETSFDIEVWAPGQNSYLEVSSCSNFTDFQARRMNLKFKDAEGKNRFCHTLNGSGTAMPRLYVALLETCQQPDGSIKIPAPLQPYVGTDVLR